MDACNRRTVLVLAVTLVALIAVRSLPAEAAVFHCASGDTACLIAAINGANANRAANTIMLEAGTYNLGVLDNDTEGPNGLPVVTRALTIIGADGNGTVIERTGTAALRIVYVGQSGVLTLEALTLKGGAAVPPNEGGGVRNHGSLALSS